MVYLPIADAQPAATIVECAKGIYAALGSGLQEWMYRFSLEAKMRSRSLEYSSQRVLVIGFHESCRSARTFHLIFCDNTVVYVVVAGTIDDDHLTMTRKFQTAFGKKTGLLINFGPTNLQYKLICRESGDWTAVKWYTSLPAGRSRQTRAVPRAPHRDGFR